MAAGRGAIAGCYAGNKRCFVMRLPEVKRDAVGEHERLGGGDLGVFDERFRATFEQTAVGLVHIDFDGRLLHVNRRFCQLLGYDKAELLTMRPGAITHPEDRGGQAAGKAQLLRGEVESASREKRYLHKSGRVVWVRATLSLARDEQGSPCHRHPPDLASGYSCLAGSDHRCT